MEKSAWFWCVFLLSLLIMLFLAWPLTWTSGGTIAVIFLLIFLLGLGVYGSPIK